jgi:hypothetical protein
MIKKLMKMDQVAETARLAETIKSNFEELGI